METNKLSEAEQAIVDAAKPKPSTAPQVSAISGEQSEKVAGRIGPEAKKEVETAKQEQKNAQPQKIPTEKPRRSKAKRQSTESPKESDDVVLVTDSFKLKQDVQKRLLRASFERKLSKDAPYTKQAIVNDALESWLVEHGF